MHGLHADVRNPFHFRSVETLGCPLRMAEFDAIILKKQLQVDLTGTAPQ